MSAGFTFRFGSLGVVAPKNQVWLGIMVAAVPKYQRKHLAWKAE